MTDKKRPVFQIRVVYKSGYTHDFPVHTFSIKSDGTYSWESADVQNKPLMIGVDEIAAVYQVGYADGKA